VAIWQHYKRVLSLFSPRMHRKRTLFMNFRSKIWPRHSFRRPRFPIRQMDFHYRVTFTGYIRCFCATTSHDLVTLTFDLLTLGVMYSASGVWPIIPIFIILWQSVTELRVLNIWSHFRYLKQSLRLRSITWPMHSRSPKATRNNFFDPELPIHCTTFMRLWWRLRVVYIGAFPC